MIPKIIHYCWFGGSEKPSEFDQWFAMWKFFLPDYEIIEWNENNFNVNYCNYSREAYLTSNYAHVSDVCRMYALNKIGGIYMDTDVQVVKPFDRYLGLNAFVSVEGALLATSVIGSRAQLPWTAAFLSYYKRSHFINIWGHTVRTPNTKLLTYKVLPKVPVADWPTIFPQDFFSGAINDEGIPVVTDNTISIHHPMGSWLHRKTTIQKVKSILDGLHTRYFSE